MKAMEFDINLIGTFRRIVIYTFQGNLGYDDDAMHAIKITNIIVSPCRCWKKKKRHRAGPGIAERSIRPVLPKVVDRREG